MGSVVKWNSKTLRSTFLGYFVSGHKHKYIRSSPVVPYNDDTLTFVNAGMNQFKPTFLGLSPPPAPRVCNSQKCIRVGGKHSDLELVGKDLHHHTFFEMLGNWSFGDYFKKEACAMAWNLLTREFEMDPKHLGVTYFGGNDRLNLPADLETRNIWLELGLSPDQIMPFGLADNFWEMGAIGPCGPCSEIHYAFDPTHLSQINQDGQNNVVELWNIVFMQYQRMPDGSLQDLPCRNIDTGMGFERLAAILQSSKSTYDTDLFVPLLDYIQQLTGMPPYMTEDSEKNNIAYRVIADHTKMASFAIADGMFPDTNYQLKHVIRRALTHQHLCTDNHSIMPKLVPVLVDMYAEFYPELDRNSARIRHVLTQEAKEFSEDKNKFQKAFPTKALAYLELLEEGNVITGADAFHLYDTFGINEVSLNKYAFERGYQFNVYDFHNFMLSIKMKSKTTSSKVIMEKQELSNRLKGIPGTDDSFKYSDLKMDSVVIRIFVNNCRESLVDEVNTDMILLFPNTNFYSEAGGQCSDCGVIKGPNGKLEVLDVVKEGMWILHKCKLVEGTLAENEPVELCVNVNKRHCFAQNHTATHLLNAALRQMLPATYQRSSVIHDTKLKFEFAVFGSKFDLQDVINIENIVNQWISDQMPVEVTSLRLKEAMHDPKLVALPGEVYPDYVRVVKIGKVSTELCCGTHVENTSELDKFQIISMNKEGSSARILKAVTSTEAISCIERASQYASKINFLCAEKCMSDVDKLSELQSLRSSLEMITLPLHSSMSFNSTLNTAIESIEEKLRKLSLARIRHTLKQTVEGNPPFIQMVFNEDPSFIQLGKVVKSCSDIPSLIVLHYGGNITARCTIPKATGTDDSEGITAEKWLQPLSKYLETKPSTLRGQDPRNVLYFKTQKIEDNEQFLEALKESENVARKWIG